MTSPALCAITYLRTAARCGVRFPRVIKNCEGRKCDITRMPGDVRKHNNLISTWQKAVITDKVSLPSSIHNRLCVMIDCSTAVCRKVEAWRSKQMESRRECRSTIHFHSRWIQWANILFQIKRNSPLTFFTSIKSKIIFIVIAES